METERISVIIPVLNEVGTIKNALAPILQAVGVEAIVVDGGSQDGTVELVKSLGVTVINSVPGRANQMNAGARAVTGEILLFLHADTYLPLGFEALVRNTLNQRSAIAGAFELRIDGSMWGLRLVERMVNWRSRYLQMPYGDQAIFLRAEVFRKLGGFPEIPLMEDFELMRRLKRQGQIAIAPFPVLTSGRRWKELGVLATTAINQIAIAAYLLGVPPERIARWYRGFGSKKSRH